MKILQLGKFYPIKGGVEKVMYDLTTGLSERSIHCDMMCTVTEKHPKIIVLNDWGRLLCCGSLVKLAATTLSPEMIMRLRKICNGYDIIHIHHPDPMACLALFLSGYKGKVVLHWHSDILKQKTLLKLYSPLQKWLIKRADLIVGTSPVYVKESPCLKNFQHKTTFLPIGVKPIKPVEQHVQLLREKYKGKKIVFSLGRLVEYKGYKYLIDAAAKLDDSYKIVIAGEGPLHKELEEQIKRMNLEDRVELAGAVSDQQRNAYFAACDVFCLSSIMKTEAFAIVQVEAMSCGVPIVATRIAGSGVSWVNKHGESGLNVEPENGEKLSEAISEICSNRNIHQEFSKNALARYTGIFTEEKMIDRCLEIYEHILNNKP